MSTALALIAPDETTPTAAPAERHAYDEAALPGDLPQELPPLFASALAGFLRQDAAPPVTLFVAPDEVLGKQTPARALALTADGVVFLEAGEATLGKTAWGVKSLLYPYTQITAVGLGMALLTARFTLHGMGNAPACEIALQFEDIPRFETAARLISERIAGGSQRAG